ncbi:MAG: hypothetical protein LBM22_01815, partial [Endomicrobium sp.]|nr:hypothetical protein [Endomicrobium sp.]
MIKKRIQVISCMLIITSLLCSCGHKHTTIDKIVGVEDPIVMNKNISSKQEVEDPIVMNKNISSKQEVEDPIVM